MNNQADNGNTAAYPAPDPLDRIVPCNEPVVHISAFVKFLPPPGQPQLFQDAQITGTALLSNGQIGRVLVESYGPAYAHEITDANWLPKLSMEQLEDLLRGRNPRRNAEEQQACAGLVQGEKLPGDEATAREFARDLHGTLQAAGSRRQLMASTPYRMAHGNASGSNTMGAKTASAAVAHARALGYEWLRMSDGDRQREMAQLKHDDIELYVLVCVQLEELRASARTQDPVQAAIERAQEDAEIQARAKCAAHEAAGQIPGPVAHAVAGVTNDRELKNIHKQLETGVEDRRAEACDPAASNREGKSHPQLISFEGIDGVGKSTQIRLLQERLTALGQKCEVLREPGGTALGEKIRSVLLESKKDTSISPEAELLLFAASRAQLMHEKVLPLLRAGTFVIMDRFIDSTMAYQGYGRGLSKRFIDELNYFATGGLLPVQTFLLDLAVDKARERLGKSPAGPDRMEAERDEFFDRVRQGFLSIARQNRRTCILGADMKPEVLQEFVWNTLRSIPHWSKEEKVTPPVDVPAAVKEMFMGKRQAAERAEESCAGRDFAELDTITRTKQAEPSKPKTMGAGAALGGAVGAVSVGAAISGGAAGLMTARDAQGRLFFPGMRQIGKTEARDALGAWRERRVQEGNLPCAMGATAAGEITIPCQARAYEHVENALIELQRCAQSGPDPFAAITPALRELLVMWPRYSTAVKATGDEVVAKEFAREVHDKIQAATAQREEQRAASHIFPEPQPAAMVAKAAPQVIGVDWGVGESKSVIAVAGVPNANCDEFAPSAFAQVLAQGAKAAANPEVCEYPMDLRQVVADNALTDEAAGPRIVAMGDGEGGANRSGDVFPTKGTLDVVASDYRVLWIPAKDLTRAVIAAWLPKAKQAFYKATKLEATHLVAAGEGYDKVLGNFVPTVDSMAQSPWTLAGLEITAVNVPGMKQSTWNLHVADSDRGLLLAARVGPRAWVVQAAASAVEAALPGFPPAGDIRLLRHPCDKITDATVSILRSWFFDNVARPAESIKNIPAEKIYVRMPAELWDVLRKAFSYNYEARRAYGQELTDALETNRHWREIFGYQIRDWTEKNCVTFWAAPGDIPAATPIAPVDSTLL